MLIALTGLFVLSELLNLKSQKYLKTKKGRLHLNDVASLMLNRLAN